jgi:hypothetical protein
MNEDQFEVMDLGLTRDATAKQAPLDFGAWTVQFRNLWNPVSTDLVVATTRGSLAATLVGVVGGERGLRQELKGVATLTDAPGEYLLAIHAQEEGVLGRLRLLVGMRDFSVGPTMADLLLVTAWTDTSPTRSDMLARIDRALVFHTDDTRRVYTELYGSASDSRARYRAAYSLLKTDDPMGTSCEKRGRTQSGSSSSGSVEWKGRSSLSGWTSIRSGFNKAPTSFAWRHLTRIPGVGSGGQESRSRCAPVPNTRRRPR